MGKYHCTIDLLFDWIGIGCMTTDNSCFYLQNRLIQTSQTGQWYNDTPPLIFLGISDKEKIVPKHMYNGTAHICVIQT